jgi:hypothetical protein
MQENAWPTRQAVEALRSINPDVVVEGEIGDIGSGSIHIVVSARLRLFGGLD